MGYKRAIEIDICVYGIVDGGKARWIYTRRKQRRMLGVGGCRNNVTVAAPTADRMGQAGRGVAPVPPCHPAHRCAHQYRAGDKLRTPPATSNNLRTSLHPQCSTHLSLVLDPVLHLI